MSLNRFRPGASLVRRGASRLPRWTSLVALAALAGVVATAAALVHADAPTNPWAKVKAPEKGASRAVGEYSTGCLRGGVALPMRGDGYQVMHPGRLRYFGHPDLIQFIETLGRGLSVQGLDPVLVGDLSQPRGGPAPKGHSSHQTGLDVDLWFWHPSKRVRGNQVETLSARSILDGKAGTIRADSVKRVTELLRLTSQDPRVNRIFVHPIIKRQLCSEVTGERDWLSKVRPWYGHDDHLHVRLSCPADSTDCVPQPPIAANDGCGELDWWFDPQAQADRAEARKKYQAKVGRAPRMPEQCWALLR